MPTRIIGMHVWDSKLVQFQFMINISNFGYTFDGKNKYFHSILECVIDWKYIK